MDVFEGKNNCYRKQLAKLGRNKFLQSRPRAAMFVTLNLARYLPTSRVMARCLALKCTLEPRRLPEYCCFELP